MKTTAELQEPLLREARAHTSRHGIFPSDVVRRGLQQLLRNSEGQSEPFRLQSIVTNGEGAEIEGDWSAIRARIYVGRGA